MPTMLEDFDDSVLGDPISYARIEQLPGSESPLSACVRMTGEFDLFNGLCHSDGVGTVEVLMACGGDLSG